MAHMAPKPLGSFGSYPIAGRIEACPRVQWVPRVANGRNGILISLIEFGVGTPVGLAGGAAGFTATFEIAAADEAGDGRVKRRPIRAGTTIAPYHPSPPSLPDLPSHPCLTQGANWGRERYLNHRASQLTTHG
jgi:hypothetical protein